MQILPTSYAYLGGLHNDSPVQIQPSFPCPRFAKCAIESFYSSRPRARTHAPHARMLPCTWEEPSSPSTGVGGGGRVICAGVSDIMTLVWCPISDIDPFPQRAMAHAPGYLPGKTCCTWTCLCSCHAMQCRAVVLHPGGGRVGGSCVCIPSRSLGLNKAAAPRLSSRECPRYLGKWHLAVGRTP